MLFRSNCFENIVATINIKVVIIKYIFPKIDFNILNKAVVSGTTDPINDESRFDAHATEKAIAKDTAISFKDISFFVQ